MDMRNFAAISQDYFMSTQQQHADAVAGAFTFLEFHQPNRVFRLLQCYLVNICRPQWSIGKIWPCERTGSNQIIVQHGTVSTAFSNHIVSVMNTHPQSVLMCYSVSGSQGIFVLLDPDTSAMDTRADKPIVLQFMQ